MATETQLDFDDTGKVVFDDCYDQPDPRGYFTSLRGYDYRIAGEAQPVMRQAVDALQAHRSLDGVRVVDVGSSYGINAALLRHDISLDDLYAHYGDPDIAGLSRDELLERDRRYFHAHQADTGAEVVGVDTAGNAVDYAVEAGLLDEGITANLEQEALDGDARDALAGTDFVMSTGCIGYVTETSIEKIMDVVEERRPWMAHTVLRMFPFEPFEELLAERGYRTERLEGTLRQRQFVNEEERAHVIENLGELDINPAGKESEGWYHANVFFSRPVEDAAFPVNLAV